MKSLNFSQQAMKLNSLKEMFLEDFHEGTTKLTKWLLEHVMEEARDRYMLEEGFDELGKRLDYRNGYYPRELRSKVGLLQNLRVPRTRSGEFFPEVLDKYGRVCSIVNEGISQMYLRGVSTSNVGPVLQALLGYEVSPSYVSTVNKGLDKLVREFQMAKLKDDVVFLFLDGIYLKHRDLLGSRRRPVLAAYAIHASGQREFVHFRIAKSESEQEWTKFLRELYSKGLEGKSLQLVISDGASGLLLALDTIYPWVKHQRCWVHKMRNLCGKIKKRHEQECLAGARLIYQAGSTKCATGAFKRWKNRWQNIYPKVVRWLEQDLGALLAFIDLPASLHILLRTTNVIERGFGEVRRRTKVMGCLPNENSINRIVYARLHMLNHRWAHAHRFIKAMSKQEKIAA